MINYISKPFRWFFKLEAASGLVLLFAAIIALFISNSGLANLYFVTLNKYLFKVAKYKSANSELLIINATIAANKRTSPLAASNLKNHLKGLEIYLIIKN